jgi:hypothetical protein
MIKVRQWYRRIADLGLQARCFFIANISPMLWRKTISKVCLINRMKLQNFEILVIKL